MEKIDSITLMRYGRTEVKLEVIDSRCLLVEEVRLSQLELDLNELRGNHVSPRFEIELPFVIGWMFQSLR